jgi:hypothetical protein
MKILLTLISLSIFIGCADRVRFSVDRPPEILIPTKDKVSFKNTKSSGSLDLQFFEKKSFLGRIGNSIANEAVQSKKDTKRFQKEYKKQLTNKIKRLNIYRMGSGNKNTTQIDTEFNYTITDKLSSSEYENNDGQKVKSFTLTRSGTMKVDVQFLNKNSVIDSKSFSVSVSEKGKGSNKSQAMNNISNWKPLVSKLINKATQRIANALAPSRYSQSVTLQDGDNDDIEEANERASDGKWKSALTTWEKFENQNNETSDASIHNIGVYHESRGELTEAISYFKRCRPSSYCDQGYSRINNLLDQRQRAAQFKSNSDSGSNSNSEKKKKPSKENNEENENNTLHTTEDKPSYNNLAR